MLQITIPTIEMWDEAKEEFVKPQEEQILSLEHSLISISKWESRWHKAFLTKREKTNDEILDYVRCMTLTPNVNPDIYNRLTNDNYKQINDYINESMTATVFTEDGSGKRNNETITNEVIYNWMISLNIPFEAQNWHLNRLITQIRVCSIKNQPPKKMSKSSIGKHQAAVNAARRKKYNTKG